MPIYTCLYVFSTTAKPRLTLSNVFYAKFENNVSKMKCFILSLKCLVALLKKNHFKEKPD